MKTRLLLAFFALALIPFGAKAQFDFSDVKFWVGSGSTQSLLVIDFHDATWDTSYAWGYLHDGTATAEDMLLDIAAADENLTVVTGGGFLNDITYNAHEGLAGNPYYFSTYSGTQTSDLAQNAGIGEVLGDGDWFACSYEPWPSNVVPGNPIAAYDPTAYTAADIWAWVGTGQDTAIFIADFHPGLGYKSFGWGVLFDGTTTGEEILNAIAAADIDFDVDMGGFLNDITYGPHAGLAGNPYYWSTWSGTNMGNLDMNMGISTVVNPGDIFACAYTNWAPAMRPDVPNSVFVGVEETEEATLSVYPQPAQDLINITVETTDNEAVTIYDLAGKVVLVATMNSNQKTLNIAHLNSGAYLLEVGTVRRKIIKS